MTMQLVSTVTVGAGGATEIHFDNIPQTGTDLLIVYSARSSSSLSISSIFLNSNFSGYTTRWLEGSGSAVTSSSEADTNLGRIAGADQTASTFSSGSVYIPNYSVAQAHAFSSELVQENNGTLSKQYITAGIHSPTAAITNLFMSATALVQYSTYSLYTITKGSGGATVS